MSGARQDGTAAAHDITASKVHRLLYIFIINGDASLGSSRSALMSSVIAPVQRTQSFCRACLLRRAVFGTAFAPSPNTTAHVPFVSRTTCPVDAPSGRRAKSRVVRAHPDTVREPRRYIVDESKIEGQLPSFLAKAAHPLRRLKSLNRLGPVTVAQSIEFFTVWGKLCDAGGSQYSGGALPPKHLIACVQATLTDGKQTPLEEWENVVFVLCRQMLHADPDAHSAIRRAGQRLLATMSAAGSVVATVRTVSSAWRQARDNPQVLRRPELSAPIAELKRIVARVEKNPQGQDCEALVLEGKLQNLQGRTKRALELWWRACGAAKLQREKLLKSKTPQDNFWDDVRSVGHLSTPWNDLTIAHNAQANLYEKAGDHNEASRQRHAAIAANGIGCELDDPWAHFNAAEYIESDWDWEADQAHSYSHKYLYHMTKAAASGIVEAAYRVAQFYFMAAWPYFANEPPDDIKPTPFDRKPAPGGTLKRTPTPAEEMFFTGVQPSNPVDRFRLAYEWLIIGSTFGYAPAYKLLAEVALTKGLPLATAPPASAVNMDASRYRDNDPANIDYEATISAPPNSKAAKDALTELCIAIGSVKTEFREKSASKLEKRLARGITQTWEEDQLVDDIATRSRHFFRWPEVRRSWIKKAPALEKEVARICDEQGWKTLLDHNGDVLYKDGKVFGGIYTYSKDDD